MVRYHVRQGETILSLSKRYGVPPDKILDHPDNAPLRDARRDAAILRPGDRVTIPDQEQKQVECATEERHRFRCNNRRCDLQVQFLRMDEPRSGEPYVLRLDLCETSGRLDDDGWLRETIPADAQEGVIILGEGAEREEYPVRVGHLDPVDEVRGVQQRLQNLGLFSDEEDDQPSEALERAVRAFQAKHDMEVTGELDQATKDRLAEVYGC